MCIMVVDVEATTKGDAFVKPRAQTQTITTTSANLHYTPASTMTASSGLDASFVLVDEQASSTTLESSPSDVSMSQSLSFSDER